MGRIVIDLPQDINEHVSLTAEEGDVLLEQLSIGAPVSRKLPRRNSAKPDLAEETEKILGIWSDRFTPDQAEQFANQIRSVGGRPD
ncbi:MAG TPA: hypothetical protein VFC63_20880 [Blastocatellia bacterium]|nr:hypothetical protein [Blastocatellia bacterium]